MANFTHTITINILTDDQRSIQVSNTDTLDEVEQVMRGYASPTMQGHFYGPTSANPPQLDAEPILMAFQAFGPKATVNIENTNADILEMPLDPKQVMVIHGTETFELGTNAATATNAETLEDVDFTNSQPNANIAYFFLLGPTS